MRRDAFPLLCLATFLCVSLAEPAALDEPAREVRYTLDEAIARAREVSATLASLDAEVTATDAQIREAEGRRLPKVILSAGYTRRSNVPELEFPQPDGSTRTVFPNLPNNWHTSVDFDVPLYTGGRDAALVDAARSERDAAGSERDTGDTDLVLDVTQAYWSLVTSRERARVLAESLVAYEAHLTDARNRQRVGLAASNEVLAVEVARDRAELGRIRAVNDAALASAYLARLLDLEGNVRIVAEDPLQPEQPSSLDIESLVASALTARPELSVLEARVSAAESRATVERASRRPHVGVWGGWHYRNPNRDIVPWEATWQDTWDVGVEVSFQVYDGGRTAAAAARADARALGLERQIDDLERAVRLEVTSRVLDVRNAEASIPVSERAVDSAQENLRVTRDRYREGVQPSSDLLDAEVDLLRAGLDRAEAQAQLRLALAELDRAVGR